MAVLYTLGNQIDTPSPSDLLVREPLEICVLRPTSYCQVGQTARVNWAHVTGSDSEDFPGPIKYELTQEPIDFGPGTRYAGRSIDEIDTHWGTNFAESLCLFNPPTPYGWFFEARDGERNVYDCKEYTPDIALLPSYQFEVPHYEQYPHTICEGLSSWDGIPKTVFSATSLTGSSVGGANYRAYQGTLDISYWSCDNVSLSGNWWVLRVLDVNNEVLFTKQFLEFAPVITVECV